MACAFGIVIALVINMSMFICASCGTEYAEAVTPPSYCAICRADARLQPIDRPAWTTLEEVRNGHENLIQRLEPNLFSIRTIPRFAAGQRALLLRTEQGNILWGGLTLIDSATVEAIQALGGLVAIAVSHPRHFSTVVEWSHSFGDIPIHVHAKDRRWLMRSDRNVEYWDGGECRLPGDVTLIHVGSYVNGGTLLYWPAGSNGTGAMLTGDVIQVISQQKHVGLLSNSRNFVPRSAEDVQKLVSAIDGLSFEALYDEWSDVGVCPGASGIVLESARCYLASVSGLHDTVDPRCSRIA